MAKKVVSLLARGAMVARKQEPAPPSTRDTVRQLMQSTMASVRAETKAQLSAMQQSLIDALQSNMKSAHEQMAAAEAARIKAAPPPAPVVDERAQQDIRQLEQERDDLVEQKRRADEATVTIKQELERTRDAVKRMEINLRAAQTQALSGKTPVVVDPPVYEIKVTERDVNSRPKKFVLEPSSKEHGAPTYEMVVSARDVNNRPLSFRLTPVKE